MKVFVTTLDNTKLDMGELFSNTNQITHLKMQIFDKTGIDPELFILTYDDKKLNNNKFLSKIDENKGKSLDLKMVLKFDIKNNEKKEKVNDKYKGMLSTNKAVEFIRSYNTYRYSPVNGVNKLIEAGKIRKDQENNIKDNLRGKIKESNSSVSSSSNISSNEANKMRQNKMKNNQMTRNMEQLSNKMRNNQMTRNLEKLSNKMRK